MNANDKLIRQAVGKILTVSKPDKIILFGSAAEGRTSPDSDLDFLVIGKNISDQRQEIIRLRSVLNEVGIPIDVFTMTPERFAETKNVIGGLAYPANKYGKVVYEIA